MQIIERSNNLYFSLQPGYFIYRGSGEKDEYIIFNTTIFKTQLCGSNYVFASIVFGRSLLGFFLTVCLPSILAILIGHMTNFFGDNKFDVAIGVNLTLMLVITTM
jgi:hypothetical protein